MDEFTFCINKSFCKRLSFDKIGKNVIIEYEDAIIDSEGEITVPNGKMAKFSCNNRTGYPVENTTACRLQGVSRLLCSNGKRHGLIDDEKPECVLKVAAVVPFPQTRHKNNLLCSDCLCNSYNYFGIFDGPDS